jgi:hypothetical protein
MPLITGGPFLSINVDLTSKRVLQSSLAIAPRSSAISFTRTDKIYGNMRMWIQSGIGTPPLYRVQATCSAFAITDGFSQIYVNATNINLIGTGDESDPRIEFSLEFIGTVLDAALNATGNPSITAFIETTLIFLSPQAQHQVSLRELCNIFKSGIYPSQ